MFVYTIFFIVCAIGIVGLFFFIFSDLAVSRSATHALEALKVRYAGKMNVKSSTTRTVQFSVDGTTFFAEAQQRNGLTLIRLKSRWPVPSLRVKIFLDKLTPKLKTFLGMEDLEIGSAKFDADYVLQSNDLNELRAILSGHAQQVLTKIGEFDLTIQSGRFIFEKDVDGLESKQIESLVHEMVKLYFHVREGSLKTEAIKMVLIESQQSTCMVCGEKVEADPVYCRSCRTPHHKDCWDYLGMCSTYACGNRKYQSSKISPYLIVPRPKKRRG